MEHGRTRVPEVSSVRKLRKGVSSTRKRGQLKGTPCPEPKKGDRGVRVEGFFDEDLGPGPQPTELQRCKSGDPSSLSQWDLCKRNTRNTRTGVWRTPLIRFRGYLQTLSMEERCGSLTHPMGDVGPDIPLSTSRNSIELGSIPSSFNRRETGSLGTPMTTTCLSLSRPSRTSSSSRT